MSIHQRRSSSRGRVAGALLLVSAIALIAVGAAIWGYRFGRERWHRPAPLILVGLDGFRWDFIARAETPNLDRIIAGGVRSERLIPAFPTKTFPNHYTLVTGLRPGRHGIVGNDIYDPSFDARFAIWDREAVRDARWWEGEPIWVAAERRGWKTAPFFWPGSEAAIGGIRPTWWEPYDHGRPHAARVDRLLELLALPAGERPVFSTLYFADVDSAAHDHDPEAAPEVAEAIRRVDHALGRLVEGLDRLGLGNRVNLIVVSDHGMAATSPERLIFLDDLVDPEIANVVSLSPFLTLWPAEEALPEVREALVGAHPHLTVWERDDLPERFHYRGHRRVAPLVGLADEGWSITTRDDHALEPEKHRGGNHGYDPELPSMGGIFLATGPDFRRGITIAPVENVHLYELMCRALRLEPTPNDGDPEVLAGLLAD